MSTARKISLGICRFLLGLSMAIFIVSMAAINTIGQPDKIKTIASESGIYDAVAETARQQLISSNVVTSQLPNDLVNNALSKAINGPAVQKIAEPVISSTYVWLGSSTPEPDISINTDSIRNEVATSIATGVTERFASLPICKPGQIPNTSDLANIDCVPQELASNLNAEQLKNFIIATDTSPLSGGLQSSELTITGAQGQQEPFYESLRHFRSFYQALKIAPLISGAIFVLSLCLVVAFSVPRFMALKALAFTFIPSGIIFIIAGLTSGFLVTSTTDALIAQLNGGSFEIPAQNIVQALTASISKYFVIAGTGSLLAGIIALVGYKKNS